MDIDFSPQDLEFQREVRAWFQANTPESLKRKVITGQMLQKDEIVQWQRKLDDRGWLVTGWPKEYGGPGWTPTQRYIFDLERAAANAPVGLSMGVIMLGPVLIAFGTPEQKAQYLPRIRRCEDWWCQGYSEPGAGSDLASLKTAAVSDGDDYVINGSKIWTTYAHWATHMFCLVRTANTGKKQEGISFLLIEMDRPGIEIRPIVSIDGEHHLNQVFFTDVRVPKRNLVGREGQGWDIAKYLLTHERTSIAGVADSKAHLANLRAAASERRSGGRPAIEDPALRLKIARAEIDLMALEYTNFRVLAATAAGKAPGPESSLLKTMGTAVQQTLSELDVELAAELAWPWHEQGEFGQGRFAHAMPRYCFSRAATIYGGSDEVQKNVLAKMLLAGGAH
ncbi:acyl-CoA dehydrogenase family protein [Extensimonas vulgaris]|mgnify:CR=1 FL=1|uniref:Alkylation response protein AidB-like acyl-CoA dehydrogenase n=1 Tax=Extensimonas vulgaris TaxID=1031594 RepID=A0A369ARI2_9BURK|nr:acyl-CoA dehydrogenase family protein [Extensimonas vulgaris]RCX11725.1 alkylation response protein AidB-like acyl-CoA dehydrogenase [Extensimonas vulgaris]TWI40620.1 alkylation response protein AidB-like acyl-CoA dehydrogenase [Extensimonas vulgaris]TXD12868.1 pimeloyl-CoA dehydrogenase large subunit [Extensimonas vulgaris]